jgi:hypothetical protein
MKISSELLTKKKILEVAQKAEGRIEELTGDIDTLRKTYDPLIFEFHKNSPVNDFHIVSNVFKALKMRISGTKALSIRELDIAARANLDLGSESSIFGLLMESSEFFLCEGVVGDPKSPWECRVRYNNGLKWFSDRGLVYNLCTDKIKPGANCTFDIEKEAVQFGRAVNIMREMYDALVVHALKPWLSEESYGFNEIFLIPEYMSVEEYSKKRRIQVLVS